MGGFGYGGWVGRACCDGVCEEGYGWDGEEVGEGEVGEELKGGSRYRRWVLGILYIYQRYPLCFIRGMVLQRNPQLNQS